MPDGTNARQLFERFAASPDPYQVLVSLVDTAQSENEWLDYKQCPMSEGGVFDKARVNELWSKAVCSFANTGGGVLVWGIEAPKEVPTDYKPIPGYEKLLQHLEENVPNATSPPVHGVEFRAFPDPGKEDRGYLVCYIPEGKHRPYRAEHCGQRYYHRAGHGFHVIPTPMLRYMFYPQTRTEYEIRAACVVERHKEYSIYDYRITIQNVGTSTAENLIVHVDSNPAMFTGILETTALSNTDAFYIASRTATLMRVYCTIDLHPEMELPFVTIRNKWIDPARQHRHESHVVIRLYCHSRNSQQRSYCLYFDKDSLNKESVTYAQINEME